MNKIDKQLLTLYILTLLIAAVVYVYFDFVSPFTQAPLAGIENLDTIQYVSEVVTELLAVMFCYLATRMMTLSLVQRRLAQSLSSYAFWARVRWLLLAIVIFLGLNVHYLFLSPTTHVCSLLGVLIMIFVFPTKGRRESEIHAAQKAFPVSCP